MKDYTISELTELMHKSFGQYDQQGTAHWTWQVAAQDLTYQIGSLHKVMLQLSGDRWANGKSTDVLEAEFVDELSDILAVALYIAAERNIDVNRAMNAMLQSDTDKVNSRKK